MKNEQQPVWISHRGLCVDADQNTAPAFDAALKSGFRSFETDLRPTRDGQIVLSHDLTLARVGGPDVPVTELTTRDLDSITLTHGGKPMLFQEFIERYAAYSWVFDIKADTGDETISRLGAWITAKKAKEWFESQAIFLFWDQRQEDALLKMLPRVRVFAQSRQCWRAGITMLGRVTAPLSGIRPDRGYGIPPKLGPFSLFKRDVVARYQSRGAKTIAYLPTTKQEAESAVSAGFDYVLTDHNFL